MCQPTNNIYYENERENIWITANAGCGKTTKLVERFLFLMENGAKIDEI